MVPVAIRQATPAELALVMEILDEAARWLLARGIHQWESPPPPDCWTNFREAIDRKHVYLITSGASDEVLGTFRVAWSGAPLWEDDANAGYLYSLAVKPRFTGQGIGRAVIERLTRQFTTSGRKKFRLDCIAANAGLRKWYEDLGFRYQGEATDGAYVLALYERDLPDLAG
jgi:ribosomal protein S18 acetylase RimI-like enzyme